MRFKTDENLHPEAADFLRSDGHDALTIWDQSLRGAHDAKIAEVCRAEQRILITFDMGFADIRAYPPEQYPGIIVLRLRSQSRQHVLSVLPRMTALLKEEPIVGRLWIIEDTDIRIREGAKG